MNREHPDDVHESIKRFCAEGDSLAEDKRYSDAIAQFEQALALVPTPREEWEAATWIHAALGDTHFLAGDVERARQALTGCMLCPNALDNPFLWLRRGQVYFELGDMKQAQDSLASAFMLAGREICFNVETQRRGVETGLTGSPSPTENNPENPVNSVRTIRPDFGPWALDVRLITQ